MVSRGEGGPWEFGTPPGGGTGQKKPQDLVPIAPACPAFGPTGLGDHHLVYHLIG